MDHDHGAMHDMPGADDGECRFSHAMVFHLGMCQEILFPGWRTHNALEVFGSAVALFVAGFLYEGLKYYREAQHTKHRNKGTDSRVNINKNDACGNENCGNNVVKYTMTSPGHLIQTGLHLFQTTISYILMLVFMTYNVWLCLALVLGMTLGYFIFGWRKVQPIDPNEHCH